MSRLRIGLIAIGILAALTCILTPKVDASRNVAAREPPNVEAARAGRADTAATDEYPHSTAVDSSPAFEFLPQIDMTGQLQESLNVDELLDLVNAEAGAGFSADDCERLAALLRSDLELRKEIAE